MIQFSLFGIPVKISPWHWVGLAFISGAWKVSSSSELPLCLLFMLGAFLSILIHELAHAFAGRRLGGGSAQITLILFGGYTEHYGSRLSKWGNRATIAAGSGVNLLTVFFFLLLCVMLLGFDGFKIALSLVMSPFSAFALVQQEIIPQNMAMPCYFMGTIMWTSFWWGLLNLLPIYPLDGGLLLKNFLRSPRRAYQTGFVTALVFTLLGLFFGGLLMTVFMAQFAYINYQEAKASRF